MFFGDGCKFVRSEFGGVLKEKPDQVFLALNDLPLHHDGECESDISENQHEDEAFALQEFRERRWDRHCPP